MQSMYSSFNRPSVTPVAPVVLRVVLGGLFVWHGIDKFDTGIDMVEEGFRMLGVPAPALAAPVVAVTEIVAGVALIVGLLTRLAAAALGVILIGALIWAKDILTDNGTGVLSGTPMPGYELDLAYLAGLVALVFIGPGPWSIDASLGLEPTARGEVRAPGPDRDAGVVR